MGLASVGEKSLYAVAALRAWKKRANFQWLLVSIRHMPSFALEVLRTHGEKRVSKFGRRPWSPIILIKTMFLPLFHDVKGLHFYFLLLFSMEHAVPAIQLKAMMTVYGSWKSAEINVTRAFSPRHELSVLSAFPVSFADFLPGVFFRHAYIFSFFASTSSLRPLVRHVKQ